ncbi:PssE/Cps14G family polysaccharide biosynthesis glycosyltransferase [Peribacillus frigoritolerans]|uniref:PssE/Cps14G family polysaccharide biosynthesis glycosyltransferase n=1 Tax=Peribacillus frigoritolerans TaxID=450367 RepID=UPI0037FDC8F5
MIFLTVGTHEQSFDRVVKAVDEYAYQNKLAKNQVIIQLGYTNYIPQNCSYSKMLSYKDMDKLYKESEVIITHGGPGSMFSPWKYGKKVIAVPRLSKFHEHVDDHQLHFCKLMEKEKKVICIEEISELASAINNLNTNMNVQNNEYLPKTSQFVENFKRSLNEIL